MNTSIMTIEDGFQVWRNNNHKLHREDGPCIIIPDGHGSEWCINGQTHRIDGPAWIDSSRNYHWYLYDKEITKEVNHWMEEQNISYPFDEDTLLQFKLRFL